MTAVTKYFFTPLYYPHDTWSVIKWWESRRPLYNLCVGAAGMVSLGTIGVLTLLTPANVQFHVPWVAILVYGALANASYTLGSVADIALRKVLGERAAPIGPVLFRYGFVFSLGLSLLPIPVATIGWIMSFFIR
jgi:hypothetical protein